MNEQNSRTGIFNVHRRDRDEITTITPEQASSRFGVMDMVKQAVQDFIERRDLLVLYVATTWGNCRLADLTGRIQMVEYENRPGEFDYYLLKRPARIGDTSESLQRELIATIIMDRPDTPMISSQIDDVTGAQTIHLSMQYNTILGSNLPEDILDGTAAEMRQLRLELAQLGPIYGAPSKLGGQGGAIEALRMAGDAMRDQYRNPVAYAREMTQEPRPDNGPDNV